MNIIVCYTRNGCIGNKGKLPSRQKADFMQFARLTRDCVVVMGRKTLETLSAPLPNRINIVITRQENYQTMGYSIRNSFTSALEFAKEFGKPTWIIGGGEIYKEALDAGCSTIYATELDMELDGDAFFKPNWSEWNLVNSSHMMPADTQNHHAYQFKLFQRKTGV